MTIAYWCVFIMILFPYFFTGIAKFGLKYDNHDPRFYLEHLTGWRKRANYVQLNSFESTPAFAVAVIIAHLTGSHYAPLNGLAIAFVITRIVYAICYITDQATLRTIFWACSMACIIGLFCIH